MPNQIGPHLEQRVIAFSLGNPGFGPRRISAELRREKWGGMRVYRAGGRRLLLRIPSRIRREVTLRFTARYSKGLTARWRVRLQPSE